MTAADRKGVVRKRLDINKSRGRRPSFDAEIKRLMSDSTQSRLLSWIYSIIRLRGIDAESVMA